MNIPPTVALDISRVPEQWRAFVEQSLKAWNTENFAVRRPLGGKSGATVMLVDIKTPKHDGQGILKLADGETLEEEREHQEQARSASNDLTRRIPVITHAHVDQGRSALLMTVAGRGLLETEMMANATGGRLNLASQRISLSLLSEWNPSTSFVGGVTRAGALLSEWLEHRIGPHGRVPDVLANVLHLPRDCEAFRYSGVDYPNPHLFSAATFSGSHIELIPGRGRIHGDLHGENVLIGGPNVEDYYFIDFSFFRTNAPIFFDHAYLELYLMLLQRERAAHERWHRLCQSLVALTDTRAVASNILDQDDHGLLWTVGMIRAEIYRWIERTVPNRLEDLKKQILLSRVAAGLNFANKRSLADDPTLSNKKKFFSVLYAATAAKALFEYCHIRVKADGPVARPESTIPPPSGSVWREVWEACAGFNSRRGSFVLLAGPDISKLTGTARALLGRLPWSLVIDFDRTNTSGAFFLGASGTLRTSRGLHQLFPHQTASVDFETGTCWLFADADPPPDSGASLPLVQWRQRTLPKLRMIAGELLKSTTPQPIYLVVFGGSIDHKRLEYTVATLEDNIGEILETVVVSQTSDETPLEGNDTARNIVCDWQDLALSVHEMLGDSSGGGSIWIPVRDPASKSMRREQIDQADATLYAETIEIVPAGPASYQPDRTDHSDVADFLRGNTITPRGQLRTKPISA